jgi:hypothetical protein
LVRSCISPTEKKTMYVAMAIKVKMWMQIAFTVIQTCTYREHCSLGDNYKLQTITRFIQQGTIGLCWIYPCMSLWRLRSKCGTRFLYSFYSTPLSWILEQNMKYIQIKVITKLPNSEQSYKGKVKYITKISLVTNITIFVIKSGDK